MCIGISQCLAVSGERFITEVSIMYTNEFRLTVFNMRRINTVKQTIALLTSMGYTPHRGGAWTKSVIMSLIRKSNGRFS